MGEIAMRKFIIALCLFLLLTTAASSAYENVYEFSHGELVEILALLDYPGTSIEADLALLEQLTEGNADAAQALAHLRDYSESSASALAALKGRVNGITQISDSVQTAGETLVWLPDDGDCYHSDPGCSDMASTRQVTLTEAIRLGYRACSKCMGY